MLMLTPTEDQLKQIAPIVESGLNLLPPDEGICQSDPEKMAAIAEVLGLILVGCNPSWNWLIDVLDCYFPGWRGYQVPEVERQLARYAQGVKVTEAETVEVGEYYLVPCVQTPGVVGYDKDEFVPVFGESHEDAEIDAPEAHFHYDWRFAMPERGVLEQWDFRLAVCLFGGFGTDRRQIFPPKDKPLPIVWRRLKCVRQQDFPSGLCKQLEPLYRGCKLESRRCPHRGADLRTIPSDAEGNVVCPMHGLKWNKATGEMVSRLQSAEVVS
jgi:hypothetical protein